MNSSMLSLNRSVTTTGAGLANKIGQAMSRIISDVSMLNFDEDGDLLELIQCVDELNTSNDLTVKFKTN
jgi:hypothetical protein